MKQMLVYPLGSTKACGICADLLQQSGIRLVDHPTPEVTHLLLDVPAFRPDGALRGGERLEPILRMLPTDLRIVGGGLDQPLLAPYARKDYLTDQRYLAENAAITAECALQIAAEQTECVYAGCRALVIGWGRIGKCLAQKLAALRSRVTVAARKEADRAMIRALGHEAVDISAIPKILAGQHIVFNTVPQLLLHKEETALCRGVLIDLASRPGMDGETVISARGLPGIYKPASAGKLMAETFLRLAGEESV